MSRRPSKSREDGEFYLECKATFLTIYDDIDDRIESKKTLNTLLQTSGRNPTRARMDRYWPRDTVELSFTDYVDICKKEPVTSADELMKAFRKIDLNGDGYISLDELCLIMNVNKGGDMTRDEVRKIIDEVDENKDGRLDYNEFTNMVMKTSEDSKRFAVKVMERKEKKKRRIEKARASDEDSVQGSRASLRSDDVPRPSPRVTLKRESKGKSPSVRSMAKLPDPRSLRDWTKFSSKGCFFYEEDEIVTHVFNLKLKEDSAVFFSAYPINEPACLSLPSTEPIDTSIYVFDGQGRLVTVSEQRDISGKYGVKLDLRKGEYQVLPYTTGCRFKQRQADQQHNMKEAKLVKKDKEDNVVITSAFRRALEDIFDLCDLDDNGTMSYDEFNWFNLRTSGEELEEEEWKVVEERTSLENGEITKKGFIELNEMEAEDVKGDTEDLWITLTSMGMNKALIMDEACPYRVDVYVEEATSKKPTFKVTGIESLEKKEFAEEICKHFLEKGEPTKIRNMKDLYMCTYKNEHWASIVVDNRSRSTVNLEVDCSRSRNVVSNRAEMDYTFEIDPQTAAVAHHLLPRSELSDWTINVTETIHK